MTAAASQAKAARAPKSASRKSAARKPAARKLYDSIEKAVAEKVRLAGAPYPARLGKAARIAVDAVDEMDAAMIDFLTARPARVKKAWKDAVRKLATEETAKPARRVLGARATAKPMDAKAGARALAAAAREAPADDPAYDTFSSTEAAEALGVTRPTVLQWIEENRLIGVKGAKRGWRIPKAQIRRRRPAPGLSDVVARIGDAETAWDFLTRVHTAGKETIDPLDALFAGKIEPVLALAEGYGRDFA